MVDRLTATKAVADTLRQMAAEELEAAVADIRLTGGQAIVAGTDVGVTLAALATQAGGSVSEARDFEASGQNFPFGTHICVVEVDRATGEVRLDRFVSVDDCGTVINPLVVEGQITGGIVQGIGQALSEAVTFDELGGSLSTTFVAYQVPGIGQIPALHTRRTETPTPNNPTGLKGVGELGATGSTPAVANAVYDALAPSGIGEEQLPMPFTPGRVWQALSEVGPS